MRQKLSAEKHNCTESYVDVRTMCESEGKLCVGDTRTKTGANVLHVSSENCNLNSENKRAKLNSPGFSSDSSCCGMRRGRRRNICHFNYNRVILATLVVLNQALLSHGGQFPVISAYEAHDGILTKLNVPPNSDIILNASSSSGSLSSNQDDKDKDGKSSRYLLLKCTATYPIQWIYSGDGIPEFTTNSTVNWETEPMVFMAAATLLKLSAHYTGNYTCRSIQNFELSKHYYLYISGDSFFTSSTGGPIQFSRHDTFVRIPCGVSNPKVRVTLQKLVDGYVNCLQVNDSLTYDGKSGFKLRLADLHQPDGEYLCIASFNGSFNFVQYNLIMDPNRQQSLYLPQPTKETSYSRLKCASYQQMCGLNAYCALDVNDEPVCKCNRHFHGNPYQKCHPECVIDQDCPSNRICYNYACEDPCPTACGPSIELVKKCQVINHKAICNYNSCNPSPCGPYSKCEDFNTRAICSCLPGHVGTPPYCSEPFPYSSTSKTIIPPEEQVTGGRPNYEFRPIPESPSPDSISHQHTQFVQQRNQSSMSSTSGSGLSIPMGPISCRTRVDCPPYLNCRSGLCENPCWPNPCGRNSNCQVQNYEAICSCAPGFIKVNQYCLPINCRSDRDCPDSKACSRNKCVNPCNGYCSENAVCAVNRHKPSCACLPGHSGNPFQGCKRISIKNTVTHGLSMPMGGPFSNSMLMAESPFIITNADPISGPPIFDRGPSADIPQSPSSNQNQQNNRDGTTASTAKLTTSTTATTTTTTTNRPNLVNFPVPTPGIVQPFKLCGASSKNSKACGSNAKCVTTPSSHAYCQCLNGYQGDPYRFCYQIISLPADPSAPASDSANNNNNNNNNNGNSMMKDVEIERDPTREIEANLEASIESVLNTNFGNLVAASGLLSSKSTTPNTLYPSSGPYFIANKFKNRKPSLSSSNSGGDSSNSNVTPVAVCATSEECPDDKMCTSGSCFDPCSLFHPVCGANQECRVEKHRAVCLCKPGYPVRIYNRCYRPGNYSSLSLCHRSRSNPCGPNSICSQTEDGISCRCSIAAEGEPPSCRLKPSSGKTEVQVKVQDTDPDLSSSILKCQENYECPELLGCSNSTCRNPCEGNPCGILARCRVYRHTAKCFCPHGFYGNPRVKCNAPTFNSRQSLNPGADSKSDLLDGDSSLEFDNDSSPSETTQRFMEVEIEVTSDEIGAGVGPEPAGNAGVEMAEEAKTKIEPEKKDTKEKEKEEEKEKEITILEIGGVQKNRTEKERQDLARYEDEIFDDSNEFPF